MVATLTLKGAVVILGSSIGASVIFTAICAVVVLNAIEDIKS